MVATVAGLLPYVADRWRAQDRAFEAFLVGVDDVPGVEAALEKANAELDDFGRLEWARGDTSRVPVVVHA